MTLEQENKRLRELLEYAVVCTTGDPENLVPARWLVPIADDNSWRIWLAAVREALFPMGVGEAPE